MNEYRLTPRTLLLWRIRLFIAFLPFFCCAAVLCFVSAVFFAVLLFLAAVFFFVYFWYFPKLTKAYKITATDEFLSVNRGVIVKTESIMPSPKMISAKRIYTPLSAALGLCTVVVSAARNRILLAAVERETADEIINRLGEEGDDEDR